MIVRAIAMQNASATGTACACSGVGGSCGTGPVKDFGGRARDISVTAGLQVLSSAAGGVKVFLQANSSSGYTALNPTGADIVAFTSRTCRDSQWQKIPWNCASATSTDRKFYRAAFTQTCTSTFKWLAAMSIEP